MRESIARGPGWFLVTVFTLAMAALPLTQLLCTVAILAFGTAQEMSDMLTISSGSFSLPLFGWLMFMALSTTRLQGPPEPFSPATALSPQTQMRWVISHANAHWRGRWANFQAQLRRLKTPPTPQAPGTCKTTITLQEALTVRGQWLRVDDEASAGAPLPLQSALGDQAVDGAIIGAPGWRVTANAVAWSQTLMDRSAVRQALDALWTHRADAEAMLIEFTPLYVRVTFESRKAGDADPEHPEAWFLELAALVKAAQTLEGHQDTPTPQELEEADPASKPRRRARHWLTAIAIWLIALGLTLLWALWFIMFAMVIGFRHMLHSL